MYAGTEKDAVYQATLATRQRDNRSALTTMFDSLINSTRNNNDNNSNSTSQNRNSSIATPNKNSRRR